MARLLLMSGAMSTPLHAAELKRSIVRIVAVLVVLATSAASAQSATDKRVNRCVQLYDKLLKGSVFSNGELTFAYGLACARWTEADHKCAERATKGKLSTECPKAMAGIAAVVEASLDDKSKKSFNYVATVEAECACEEDAPCRIRAGVLAAGGVRLLELDKALKARAASCVNRRLGLGGVDPGPFMQRHTDLMCACKDKACADRAVAHRIEEAKKLEGKPQKALSPDEQKKLEDLAKRLADCTARATEAK